MRLSRRKLSDYTASRLLSGEKVAVVMKELAAYLVDTRRTRELELIVRDIETRLLASGIALATVIVARPLSASATKEIESFVMAERSEVKRVVIREQVDETVIAGARIQLPGSVADLTVKAKLDKLTA